MIGKKYRLYPESTEIFLEGKLVTLIFESEEMSKDFYDLLEKLRGRDFIVRSESDIQ